MPTFTYRGDERYYPDLQITVRDGDTVTFDDPPDPRWVAAKKSAVKTDTEVAKPDADPTSSDSPSA